VPPPPTEPPISGSSSLDPGGPRPYLLGPLPRTSLTFAPFLNVLPAFGFWERTRPFFVLTAHVHSYQRFTRTLDGKALTYLVAGAGGYWHLHYMAKDENGQPLQVPWQVPGLNAVLESYVEDVTATFALRPARKSFRLRHRPAPAGVVTPRSGNSRRLVRDKRAPQQGPKLHDGAEASSRSCVVDLT
jgi:hypothetical protein